MSSDGRVGSDVGRLGTRRWANGKVCKGGRTRRARERERERVKSRPRVPSGLGSTMAVIDVIN